MTAMSFHISLIVGLFLGTVVTVMLYPMEIPQDSEPLIAFYGTVVSSDASRKTVVLEARNPYAPAQSARFEIILSRPITLGKGNRVRIYAVRQGGPLKASQTSTLNPI